MDEDNYDSDDSFIKDLIAGGFGQSSSTHNPDSESQAANQAQHSARSSAFDGSFISTGSFPPMCVAKRPHSPLSSDDDDKPDAPAAVSSAFERLVKTTKFCSARAPKRSLLEEAKKAGADEIVQKFAEIETEDGSEKKEEEEEDEDAQQRLLEAFWKNNPPLFLPEQQAEYERQEAERKFAEKRRRQAAIDGYDSDGMPLDEEWFMPSKEQLLPIGLQPLPFGPLPSSRTLSNGPPAPKAAKKPIYDSDDGSTPQSDGRAFVTLTDLRPALLPKKKIIHEKRREEKEEDEDGTDTDDSEESDEKPGAFNAGMFQLTRLFIGGQGTRSPVNDDEELEEQKEDEPNDQEEDEEAQQRLLEAFWKNNPPLFLPEQQAEYERQETERKFAEKRRRQAATDGYDSDGMPLDEEWFLPSKEQPLPIGLQPLPFEPLPSSRTLQSGPHAPKAAKKDDAPPSAYELFGRCSATFPNSCARPLPHVQKKPFYDSDGDSTPLSDRRAFVRLTDLRPALLPTKNAFPNKSSDESEEDEDNYADEPKSDGKNGMSFNASFSCFGATRPFVGGKHIGVGSDAGEGEKMEDDANNDQRKHAGGGESTKRSMLSDYDRLVCLRPALRPQKKQGYVADNEEEEDCDEPPFANFPVQNLISIAFESFASVT